MNRPETEGDSTRDLMAKLRRKANDQTVSVSATGTTKVTAALPFPLDPEVQAKEAAEAEAADRDDRR